ncbi:hypothetical protein HMPREF3027_08765 [Porphyromonas sp. HMSC077F02]|uniref:RagB/SusD family nutrient uptake outer membrane protein n=1 Tax=Porphyromonas sp. HMSC077F02 TaxID=1739529 RepID=UPI0008A1E908|nr:RagB/SusD family nutrient uptake outer membrane protein [Porphyromonas sp. HMSC077F02]OFO51070.1 hypothetical protein HMPREF3027_08765 [Porphyromonas sp. HMSC077F02]
MKRIYLMTLVASILGVSLGSCDLKRTPTDAIPTDESLQTVVDLSRWETGATVALRSMQQDIYVVTQDLQADQIVATSIQANHYAGSLAWDALTTSDYNRRDVYIKYYQTIANVNKALNEAKGLTVPDKDKDRYDQLIGRLHFIRAYCYANLAVRYGIPYKAESAKTDLCVPLLLKYEPQGTPERATNEAIYDQILNKDLAEARKLLAKTAGKPMATDVTKDAVEALDARVRLYMSDWAGALSTAKKLIDAGTYPLVEPKAENFTSMWVNDNSKEEILQLSVSRPDETVYLEPYFGASTDKKRSDGTEGVNAPDYLPTQQTLDLYDDSDLRKAVYFDKQECNLKDKFYQFYLIAKHKGNPEFAENTNKKFTYWGGYLPNTMHKPKVFRIAEMYLIASEAAYKTNDEGAAKKYLNALRKSRGLDDVTSSGDALYNDIKDERTRELAFEGFRLWDLRRWNMPVKRGAIEVNGGYDHLRPGVYNVEYKAGDFRFLWPIPANDINTNKNLVQNPGWN